MHEWHSFEPVFLLAERYVDTFGSSTLQLCQIPFGGLGGALEPPLNITAPQFEISAELFGYQSLTIAHTVFCAMAITGHQRESDVPDD
jgi:hypothetical protein